MIFIEWWQLGIIGLCVFASVIVAERVSSWTGARKQDAYDRKHGPYRCDVHMGTDLGGVDWWCVRQHGHDGQHMTSFGLDEDEFLDGPTEEEEDAMATAAWRALSDPEAFTETQETTFEKLLGPAETWREVRDDSDCLIGFAVPEPQCDSRNLGGQGHRCLYPADHTGEHHFGTYPADPS